MGSACLFYMACTKSGKPCCRPARPKVPTLPGTSSMPPNEAPAETSSSVPTELTGGPAKAAARVQRRRPAAGAVDDGQGFAAVSQQLPTFAIDRHGNRVGKPLDPYGESCVITNSRMTWVLCTSWNALQALCCPPPTACGCIILTLKTAGCAHVPPLCCSFMLPVKLCCAANSATGCNPATMHTCTCHIAPRELGTASTGHLQGSTHVTAASRHRSSHVHFMLWIMPAWRCRHSPP